MELYHDETQRGLNPRVQYKIQCSSCGAAPRSARFLLSVHIVPTAETICVDDADRERAIKAWNNRIGTTISTWDESGYCMTCGAYDQYGGAPYCWKCGSKMRNGGEHK